MSEKIIKKSKRRRKSGSFEKILTCFSFASCLFIAHTLINDGQVCWHNFRSIFLCMATWYLFGSRNEKKTQLVQYSYNFETKVSEKKRRCCKCNSAISHDEFHHMSGPPQQPRQPRTGPYLDFGFQYVL